MCSLNSSSCIFFPPKTGESPVPPPSTVSTSALSTSAVAPPLQPKPGSSSQQDRKVPPPIGTERLARIRQTGSVNPPLLTTSYTASVGQGGIWSFGVGGASGKCEAGLSLWELRHISVQMANPLHISAQRPCLVGPNHWWAATWCTLSCRQSSRHSLSTSPWSKMTRALQTLPTTTTSLSICPTATWTSPR